MKQLELCYTTAWRLQIEWTFGTGKSVVFFPDKKPARSFFNLYKLKNSQTNREKAILCHGKKKFQTVNQV